MELINNNNKGQVALIVLLISAVALTLGLSASKKAITDTKVDQDESELKNAFNVAESGINQYLSIGTTGDNAYVNNDSSAKANISIQSIGAGTSIASDGVILDGQKGLFWLVNHNTDGSIGTAYYNKNVTLNLTVDSAFNGALKIDYFYKNGAVYSVTRSGYNFNTTPIVANYIESASKTVNINIGSEDALLLVVTPIGRNVGSVTLRGPGVFPVQGEVITAVGEVGNGIKTQIKTINKYSIPDFFTESVSAINEISP